MDIKNQRYQKLKKEVKEMIKFDEFEKVFDCKKEIKIIIEKFNFQKNNCELINLYNKLIVKLDWLSLNFSSDKQIFKLFNNNFQEALDMKYFNLWEKLRSFLLGVGILEDRDRIKLGIKNILNRNKALLTSKKLRNNLSPTVENWIKIYISNVGNGLTNSVKLIQFYLKNEDYKNLSEEEKRRVINYFKFYERLKYSSSSVEGIEITVPIKTLNFNGWIMDGQLVKKEKFDSKIERISKAVKLVRERNSNDVLNKHSKNDFKKIISQKSFIVEKNIAELKIMANKYPKESLERKAIEEEIIKARK